MNWAATQSEKFKPTCWSVKVTSTNPWSWLQTTNDNYFWFAGVLAEIDFTSSQLQWPSVTSKASPTAISQQLYTCGWCTSSTTMWMICCCCWQTSRQTPKKYYETFLSVIVFSLLTQHSHDQNEHKEAPTASTYIVRRFDGHGSCKLYILELRYWVVALTAN